jgi:hypothetical protein
MRYELKVLGLMLGLSVSLAQGSKAIGGHISKDGIKALSTRFSLGDNPYLSVALIGGLGPTRSYVAGLSFQHLFEMGGGCASGACCRRGFPIQPYIDLGMRVMQQVEGGQTAIQGVAGGGLLLPLGPVEAFAQVQGVKALADQGLKVDIGGGLRIRF